MSGPGAMAFILLGASIVLAGGLAALVLPPRLAGPLAAGCVCAGAALGLGPVLSVLTGGPTLSFAGAWPMPNGAFLLELDPLSAFFLAPVLLLSAVTAVYGVAYLPRTSRLPPFGFNLLVAAMMLVVLARNGVLFLVGWEAMAVTAFFLIAYEHHDEKTRRAGYVYLIATHLGAAALFALFLLLARGAGSYDFAAFARSPPTGSLATLAVVLALLGFGAKAGFVPLHVWLPEAHAAAPSHVSALMSGVMIKLGLYGVLRVLVLMGPPEKWWGPALALIGLAGAVVGIGLSSYQRDLKRALAYSSVENVGLITLALGTAYWGASEGHAEVAALAMAAALLHTWNHGLMKGTLFLAAGSVVHATGERDLEKLGGLGRKMPLTTLAFATGALALAALPPLNGFVSEWLLYRSLIAEGLAASGPFAMGAMLAVGAVAAVGALAALGFVRLLGIGLLGQPRSERAAAAHESPRWLVGPPLLLAGLCLTAALAPVALVRLTEGPAAQLLHDFGMTPLAAGSAGLPQLAWANLLLLGLLAAVALVLREQRREQPEAAAETWGCGYPAPTARMEYRGRSFAQLFSELPVAARAAAAALAPGAAGALRRHRRAGHRLRRPAHPRRVRARFPPAGGEALGLFLAAAGRAAVVPDVRAARAALRPRLGHPARVGADVSGAAGAGGHRLRAGGVQRRAGALLRGGRGAAASWSRRRCCARRRRWRSRRRGGVASSRAPSELWLARGRCPAATLLAAARRAGGASSWCRSSCIGRWARSTASSTGPSASTPSNGRRLRLVYGLMRGGPGAGGGGGERDPLPRWAGR